MNTTGVIGGVVLVAIAALMLRFRVAIAQWMIDTRVESIRRVRMQNADYEQRQIDSLRTPGSFQLQRVIVASFGIFVAVAGIWCVVRGLGFGA